MQRANRLSKNRQFQYVYRRGKSAASKEMVLLYVRANRLQVGFSVSKKVGNAVVRNRTKRRLRACFRSCIGKMKPGLYVIIARPACADAAFPALLKSVHYLLGKQNLRLADAPEKSPCVCSKPSF